MYVSDEKWVVFQEAYEWLVLENFKWFFRMTWRQVPSAPFFTQGINTKFDLIDEHVQKMMEMFNLTIFDKKGFLYILYDCHLVVYPIDSNYIN